MRRFERWLKPIGALVGTVATLATVMILYANYRHTVTHDDELLKVAAPPPRVLPNISTKTEDQASQKQPEQQPQKEPEKPVADQQTTADTPPVETPKEPPKEAPKPFTFGGYFQTGQQLRPGILFQVNSCNVGKTLVTCSMEAVSPQYDRTFSLNWNTMITDHDGDSFRVQLNSFDPLQLDRNASVPFRLDFPVNKDVVEPITVRINGYDTNAGNIQRASFLIGPARPQS